MLIKIRTDRRIQMVVHSAYIIDYIDKCVYVSMCRRQIIWWGEREEENFLLDQY